MRRSLSAALLLILLAALPALGQTETPADSTAAAAPAPAMATDGLRVAEAAFGTSITDRMLEGAAYSFPVGARVYCWTRLVGGAPGDTIQQVWLHDGTQIQSVALPVNEDHWRTWSYKTLFPGQSGPWSVEVRGADGSLLGSYAFTASE